MVDRPNLSTEYQPKGAAADPSDTLDRRPATAAHGGGEAPAEGDDDLPPPQPGSPEQGQGSKSKGTDVADELASAGVSVAPPDPEQGA